MATLAKKAPKLTTESEIDQLRRQIEELKAAQSSAVRGSKKVVSSSLGGETILLPGGIKVIIPSGHPGMVTKHGKPCGFYFEGITALTERGKEVFIGRMHAQISNRK